MDHRDITCGRHFYAIHLQFNVQRLKFFSPVQQLFVGDRLPWITLARNTLQRWGNDHLEV